MFPVTYVSASALLPALGRPEPLESFSPLLVDGLPESTVDSRTQVQLSARQPSRSSAIFLGSPSLDRLEYSGLGLESGTTPPPPPPPLL